MNISEQKAEAVIVFSDVDSYACLRRARGMLACRIINDDFYSDAASPDVVAEHGFADDDGMTWIVLPRQRGSMTAPSLFR
jgi:hypothetical protein